MQRYVRMLGKQARSFARRFAGATLITAHEIRSSVVESHKIEPMVGTCSMT